MKKCKLSSLVIILLTIALTSCETDKNKLNKTIKSPASFLMNQDQKSWLWVHFTLIIQV